MMTRPASDTEEELLRLVARLVHDVTGAISPLPTNLRYAQERTLDPEARGALGEALDVCDRTVRVLKDADRGLRLRAGRYRPRVRPLDPAALAEPARRAAGTWLESRTLEIDLPSGTFFTDPDLLEMAVRLLVRHALPRMDRGGRARLAGRREGDRLAITLGDEGPPFAAGETPSFVSGVVPGDGRPPEGARRDGIELYHAGLAVRALGGAPRAEAAPAGQPGMIFAFELPPLLEVSA